MTLFLLTAAWTAGAARWLMDIRRPNSQYRSDFLLLLFSAVLVGLTGGIFLGAWTLI